MSGPCPEHSLQHVLPDEELQAMPQPIQDLAWKAINMKERMLDKGRVFEAYKDLAALTREALLFRKFNSKRHIKSTRSDSLQTEVEKKIYRLIIDLDIRICMHIGMPLEVQPEKNPTPPKVSTNEATMATYALEQLQWEYRRITFDVLTTLDKLSDEDDSTVQQKYISDLKSSLHLLQKHDITIPAPVSESEDMSAVLAECHIEYLSLSLLLACILGTIPAEAAKEDTGATTISTPKSNEQNAELPSMSYTEMATASSRRILQMFAKATASGHVPTWTSSYAVFCAATILSIDALIGGSATHDYENIKLVVDYLGTATRERSNEFYGLAYAQLSQLWVEIKALSGKTPKSKEAQHQPSATDASLDESNAHYSAIGRGAKRRRNNKSDTPTTRSPAKRQRTSANPRVNLPNATLVYGQPMTEEVMYPSGLGSDYNSQVYNWPGTYKSTGGPTSADTSFSSSIHMEPAYDVPSSAVPPSSHAASSNTFGFRMWYHPPFAQPEPPLEPLEHWESVPQNLYRDFLYASGGGNSLDYVDASTSSFERHAYTSPMVPHMASGALVSPQGVMGQDSWAGVPVNASQDASDWNAAPQSSRRMSAIEEHLTQYGYGEAQAAHDRVHMSTGGEWRPTGSYHFDGELQDSSAHWSTEQRARLWPTPVTCG
ncbi:uncharacterized protein HMPREF1541_07334 [Cyphellophora europaea CBS 101466]|uniref:Uncharacterized protein n=1 Tax=Cyphellophora europaea (strain CBS 101466) TaxID=1220924 RepID=W2RMG4_CYPE1|nr:uncharacterized protein HMPREF1541_07334 [Cyphellophora europaea CBS 101466]ETN37711.1 hypothetical protein HMPREF1541_07334 [Cyphellophora europaea CBS 101466]